MISADVLARSLVGERLRTPSDAAPNTILEVENGQVLVATRRSRVGRRVPLSWLQDVLDRLGSGKELEITPASIGHRSSFLGAVLLTLPMVEVIDGTPPIARLAGPAPPAPDVLREFETRLRMHADLLSRGGRTRVRPAVLRDIGIYFGARGVWTETARTRGSVVLQP